MKSIVIELQRDALDKNVAGSDLLRKALVVARKLGIAEFEAWISKELNGYQRDDLIPDYRILHGSVEGWNPYHGWQSVMFEDPKEGELASTLQCGQSVAECEAILRTSRSASTLGIRFPPQTEHQLIKGLKPLPTRVILRISEAGLAHIVDTVRTIVLNWALKLEQDGVKGEDLTFTPDEKIAAGKISYNINNFYGPVQAAQVQQTSDSAMQFSTQMTVDFEPLKRFLEELQRKIEELVIAPEETRTLRADLDSVAAQLRSPKPKLSILKDCLTSLRNILENAGGTIAGELLMKLGPLLAQLTMR